MMVSDKSFRNVTVFLAVVAVLLLPFWPWSHWGFVPSLVVISLFAMMFALRALARD
jgi:hypothetical protein